MSQNSLVVANGTGAAVRSAVNNALNSLVTNNSGTGAPSTTYAYMLWADTTNDLLKIRNAANSAWASTFRRLFGVRTGMPKLSATLCTGEGRSSMPRPAGCGARV